MSIKENIARINQLKQEAAWRSGRSGEDVLLVAVTMLITLLNFRYGNAADAADM